MRRRPTRPVPPIGNRNIVRRAQGKVVEMERKAQTEEPTVSGHIEAFDVPYCARTTGGVSGNLIGKDSMVGATVLNCDFHRAHLIRIGFSTTYKCVETA